MRKAYLRRGSLFQRGLFWEGAYLSGKGECLFERWGYYGARKGEFIYEECYLRGGGNLPHSLYLP